MDRVLATRLGLQAVETASAGRWGHMAAVRGNDVVEVPLESATAEPRPVPRAWIEAGRVVA